MGAPSFREIVLICVAAACFCAAFTKPSVASKLMTEVDHSVACPPHWLPLLLAFHRLDDDGPTRAKVLSALPPLPGGLRAPKHGGANLPKPLTKPSTNTLADLSHLEAMGRVLSEVPALLSPTTALPPSPPFSPPPSPSASYSATVTIDLTLSPAESLSQLNPGDPILELIASGFAGVIFSEAQPDDVVITMESLHATLPGTLQLIASTASPSSTAIVEKIFASFTVAFLAGLTVATNLGSTPSTSVTAVSSPPAVTIRNQVSSPPPPPLMPPLPPSPPSPPSPSSPPQPPPEPPSLPLQPGSRFAISSSELIMALNDEAVDKIVLKAGTYEFTGSMCATLARDYEFFGYDLSSEVLEYAQRNLHSVSALCINRTVTIEAEVAGSVVLDAKGLRRVIHVQPGGTAELVGLNITGGLAAFGGGLLVYPGGVANITGCNIHNNAKPPVFAPGGGGLCILGEATLRDCNIFDNEVTRYGEGGGLRIDGEAKLINCQIYNNSAPSGGGLAIYRVANLEGCSIYSNIATEAGGGLSISENFRVEKATEANLVNCKIYRNKAVEVQSRIKPVIHAQRCDAFPMPPPPFSGWRSGHLSWHGEIEQHHHSR